MDVIAGVMCMGCALFGWSAHRDVEYLDNDPRPDCAHDWVCHGHMRTGEPVTRYWACPLCRTHRYEMLREEWPGMGPNTNSYSTRWVVEPFDWDSMERRRMAKNREGRTDG